MASTLRTLTLGFTAILFLFAAAPSAQAALGRAEQTCVKAMNRDLQGVMKMVGREICRCIRNHNRGNITDIEQCVADDDRGRIQRAQARTVSDETRRCADAPSVFFTGASIVNQAGSEKMLDLLTAIYGDDIEAGAIDEATNPPAARCQERVGRRMKACQDMKLKQFNRCKKIAMANGATTNAELEACVFDDPRARIAKICGRIGSEIDRKCVGAGVALDAAFPGCDSTDPVEVATCLESKVECLACQAVGRADAINPNCDLIDDGAENGSCVLDECEQLNAAECLLPYPSTQLMVTANTPTGWRVNLPQSGMPVLNGPLTDPGPTNELDGFSPNVAILMHFPQGVSPELTGASRLLEPGCCGQPAGPPWIDTRTYDGRSLDANSPTILMDALTGDRVLHYIEPDARATTVARQATIMRPAKLLTEGRRYIVAMRNLVDPNGNAVLPEAAFAALRDGTAFFPVEGRRQYMEDNVFTPLVNNGVTRSELVLAFDFVVQSQSQLTRQILSMRDQGYAYLAGFDGDPNDTSFFTVNSVDENVCDPNDPNDVVWREISGTFEAPLFLTAAPDATNVPIMNVDPNDLPVQNGVYDVPMDFSIPCSALDPNGPVNYPIVLGHGLFGTGASMTQGIPEGTATVGDWDYIAGATDWQGLSSPDFVWVGGRIIGFGINQLNNFPAFVDRLRQGMTNTLVLTRMMKSGVLNRDPAFQTPGGDGVFPGSSADVFYYGISLGGVMGTYFSGLTPDVERFHVDVPSLGFNCLLQRSTQFDTFDLLLDAIGLTDKMQLVLGIGLLHELWAGAEPVSVANHITTDPLPGAGSPSRILMTPAWLDKQVSNQCVEVTARTLGLSNVAGSLQAGLQGIPDVSSPQDSGYVMYDTGAFDIFNPLHAPFIPPLANVIPSGVCDPHGRRPVIEAGVLQRLEFLQPGGQVVNFCTGLCDSVEPLEVPPNLCDPLAP